MRRQLFAIMSALTLLGLVGCSEEKSGGAPTATETKPAPTTEPATPPAEGTEPATPPAKGTEPAQQ